MCCLRSCACGHWCDYSSRTMSGNHWECICSFRISKHESQHAVGKMKKLITSPWPRISKEVFLLIRYWLPCWPRPCFVVARGSFLTHNVYEVRTWATTGCRCLAAECFSAWLSFPPLSDGDGWSKSKTLSKGVFCLTGEVSCFPVETPQGLRKVWATDMTAHWSCPEADF